MPAAVIFYIASIAPRIPIQDLKLAQSWGDSVVPSDVHLWSVHLLEVAAVFPIKHVAEDEYRNRDCDFRRAVQAFDSLWTMSLPICASSIVFPKMKCPKFANTTIGFLSYDLHTTLATTPCAALRAECVFDTRFKYYCPGQFAMNHVRPSGSSLNRKNRTSPFNINDQRSEYAHEERAYSEND